MASGRSPERIRRQAIVERLTIVTRNEEISRYPVPVMTA
jgi:hypothetical protein